MIDIYSETNKDMHRLYLNGHATGNPQVCAAVSAIVSTLEYWLIGHEDEISAHASDLSEGKTKIFYRGDGNSQAVYDACMTGLAQIARAYPDLVRIREYRL